MFNSVVNIHGTSLLDYLGVSQILSIFAKGKCLININNVQCCSLWVHFGCLNCFNFDRVGEALI